MAVNNVFKNKDDVILNPKIPRYEKTLKLVSEIKLESNSDEIIVDNLKVKSGSSFQIIVDGAIDNITSDYENIRCYPNNNSTFLYSRVIGIENRNTVITSIFNSNTQSLYIGRSDNNANFLVTAILSYQGNFIKSNGEYGSSTISGFINSLINFDEELLTSLKIKINSGTFRSGTKVKIYV